LRELAPPGQLKRYAAFFGMNDEDAHGVEIRRMLKSCPACQQNLDDHSYALFAITVASNDRRARLSEFFDTLKAHDWRKAMEFEEFEGLLNAAEAFALECVSGAVVLLLVRDPFELYDAHEILDCEILDSSTDEELVSLIDSIKWRRLSTGGPRAA
jgi:hypothetical protein